jgi:hypothetical protein
MKLWILRYELAPATIAKIANRTTCGRRYSLPSARRGSSISANSVRNGVNCMATSACPIRVAYQRVRDFASQESSIASPGATLPAGVAIWTHPSSTERCTAVGVPPDGSKTHGPVSAVSAITATGKPNVVVRRTAKRVSAINRARENLIGPTSNFNLSRHPSDANNPAPAANQSQVEWLVCRDSREELSCHARSSSR